MPHGTGIELLQSLKAQGIQTPLVFISANSDREQLQSCKGVARKSQAEEHESKNEIHCTFLAASTKKINFKYI